MGKKPTWKDHQLIEAIPNCKSFNEVAVYLNMSKSTNTLLRKRANQLGLDYSHFKISGKTPRPIEEFLIYKDGVGNSSHRLKLRLFDEKYFEAKCYCCGITEWNGKPAPLELEHKNGNRCDNRLENLTILCPNCHAQTETYRGKNIIKKDKKKTIKFLKLVWPSGEGNLLITDRRSDRNRQRALTIFKYCQVFIARIAQRKRQWT